MSCKFQIRRAPSPADKQKRRARPAAGGGGATDESGTTAALRASTGITDERLLAELRDLGFTSDTARLLHLVPLVQVAWSAGGVSRRERKLITDVAELRGVRYGSPAFGLLRTWLEGRPPERLFTGALAVIRASLEEAPARVREHTLRTLALHCTQVAASSREHPAERGPISGDEHETLEAILAALECGPPGATPRLVQ